jgi:hypothetical protein
MRPGSGLEAGDLTRPNSCGWLAAGVIDAPSERVDVRQRSTTTAAGFGVALVVLREA